MFLRRRVLLAALLAVLSVGASAQAICEAIVRSGLHNQTRSASKSDQYALQKANFCVAEYDKASEQQRLQIEASYGPFSAGGAKSQSSIRERQRQECDSKYGEFWFNQSNLVEQKFISEKAMETVAQCIAALSNGLDARPTFSPNESQFTLSMTWRRPGALPLKRVIATPAASMNCKLDGVPIESADLFRDRVLKANESLTVVCERRAEVSVIAGEQVACLPEALVVIDALESPLTLPLFRRCATDFLISKAQEVQQAVAAIDGRVAQVRSDLARTNSAISTLGDKGCKWSDWKSRELASDKGTQLYSCPATNYMRGIEFRHGGGQEWWREQVRHECCSLR